MKKNIVLATIALASSFAVFAHNKHVHGEGRLDVAIDNTTVSLDLELPLDAVVGFERPPKNDKEKAALTLAEKTLKDAVALWILTPAANCRIESAQVSLPKFEGEHADIDANYLFRCSNPSALKSIETSLFKSLKRLYRIEVQRIGPNGQGAARLSPNKPVLSW
jgi:hypothetical protein